jgi:hypothetical protein
VKFFLKNIGFFALFSLRRFVRIRHDTLSRPSLIAGTFVMGLLSAIGSMGCQSSSTAESVAPIRQPATPSTAVGKDAAFESAAAKIRLRHPAAWRPRPSDDFILLLARSQDPASPTLSLDVPSLPFHLPGMIGIGLVQNGYLDDLKKQHPGLKTEPVAERAAGRVVGRRVESSWTENGQTRVELALLLVHRDRVYILRVNGPAADRVALRQVFDEAVDSIEWLN